MIIRTTNLIKTAASAKYFHYYKCKTGKHGALAPYLPVFADYMSLMSLIAIRRSMVNQVHKPVKLRRYYDFCAAVQLASVGSVVGGNGIILSAAAGGKPGRINTEFVLQALYHRGCAQCAQIPVVADIGERGLSIYCN